MLRRSYFRRSSRRDSRRDVPLRRSRFAEQAEDDRPAAVTGNDCHAVTLVQATGVKTSPDYAV